MSQKTKKEFCDRLRKELAAGEIFVSESEDYDKLPAEIRMLIYRGIEATKEILLLNKQ